MKPLTLQIQIREIVLRLVYQEPASFNRVQPGELTREGGQVFVQQFSHFTRNFPRWLAAVAANCTDQAAKKFLAANIYEEEVGESEQGSHFELLVKQGVALGLSRQDIDSTRPFPTTALAINALETLCRNRTWIEGLAATTSLECINDPALRKTAGVIILNDVRAWEHLGLNQKALRSRTIHMEGDKKHVREGLHILLQQLSGHSDCATILQAATSAIFAFRILMEGIGQKALKRSGFDHNHPAISLRHARIAARKVK